MSASAGVDLGVADPRTWAKLGVKYGRMAVYAEDPVSQIAVNLVIIVAAMLSSVVGFAPGIVIALIALFFIGVAIVRLIVRAVV